MSDTLGRIPEPSEREPARARRHVPDLDLIHPEQRHLGHSPEAILDALGASDGMPYYSLNRMQIRAAVRHLDAMARAAAQDTE